jgi:hypothetical protein
MHDAYTSDDDDALRERVRKRHAEQEPDGYQSPAPATTITTRRPRIDPVRDIIAAQAQARQHQHEQQQQQQRIELALPLSGAAIVPSSFSDLDQHRDSPSLNITLPPAPRTTSVPTSEHAPSPAPTSHTTTSASAPRASRPPRMPRFTASHRIVGTTGLITRFPRSSTPPILSAFQVSRAPSPGSASEPSPKPAPVPPQPASKAPDNAADNSALIGDGLFDYIYPGGLKEDTCSSIVDIHSAILDKHNAIEDIRKATGEIGNTTRTKRHWDRGRANAKRARANADVDGASSAADEAHSIVDEAFSNVQEPHPINIVHETRTIVDESCPIADTRTTVADGSGAILDMEITEQRDIMSVADLIPRGKRSRPTPHQLAVLRALHAKTSSPSIEERMTVGKEIGMYVLVILFGLPVLTFFSCRV